MFSVTRSIVVLNSSSPVLDWSAPGTSARTCPLVDWLRVRVRRVRTLRQTSSLSVAPRAVYGPSAIAAREYRVGRAATHRDMSNSLPRRRDVRMTIMLRVSALGYGGGGGGGATPTLLIVPLTDANNAADAASSSLFARLGAVTSAGRSADGPVDLARLVASRCVAAAVLCV
jgi:hypothetical protein